MMPSLSVVIPAFNEERALGKTLAELAAYLRGTGLTYEIVVVDDGSTDQTVAVAREVALSDSAIRVISVSANRGKGAAVRRGVQEAAGEVIAFIDADLPYSTQNLGDAIALVHSGSTDIAIGARDLRSSNEDYSYPLLRRFMGKSFSLIVTTFLLPEIPDTQCGLKVFSAGAARMLFSESKINGFGFDFEVLFLAKEVRLPYRAHPGLADAPSRIESASRSRFIAHVAGCLPRAHDEPADGLPHGPSLSDLFFF